MLIAEDSEFTRSFEGVLSPDEAITWHDRVPGLPGRLAREKSVVTLYRSSQYQLVDIGLVNLADRSLRVEVAVGAHRTHVRLGPGDRHHAVLPLEEIGPFLYGLCCP